MKPFATIICLVIFARFRHFLSRPQGVLRTINRFNAEVTFLDLLNGAINDCPSARPKIFLQVPGGRTLLVCVMDRDLRIFVSLTR